MFSIFLKHKGINNIVTEKALKWNIDRSITFTHTKMLHNSQIAKRKIGEDINVSSELVVLQVAAQHNNTRKFMALDQYSTIMNQKIHVLHFLHASQ